MTALLMLMLATDPAGQSDPDVLLLDFTAGYCQPCQQMVPILQRMEHDGFPVRKVDITTHHELTRQYNVEVIPTLVLLVQGQEVKRFVGLTAESELRREMNSAARALRPATRESAEETDAADDAASGTLTDEFIRTADAVPTAPRKKSFRALLAGLFGGSETADDEPRTIRGQDPGQSDTAARNRLVEAYQATVRIRVADSRHEDVGTGTIIHSTAGSSLILTCAHLFTDFSQDAAVQVDVFRGESAKRYPARIVAGDHNSDLAVIEIRNAEPLPHIKMSATPTVVTVSQPLISFGCNDGNDPSHLETRVSKLNPYLGPANLTCDVPPVQGRSGGGLFNLEGDLIGVCSARDPERTEGLYMAHQAVADLLTHFKLTHVLNDGSGSAEDASDDGGLDQEFRNIADATPQNPAPSDSPAPLFSEGATETAAEQELTVSTGPEITIVIDPKTPGSQKRIVVIPQASPWLVELLTGETPAGQPGTTVASR